MRSTHLAFDVLSSGKVVGRPCLVQFMSATSHQNRAPPGGNDKSRLRLHDAMSQQFRNGTKCVIIPSGVLFSMQKERGKDYRLGSELLKFVERPLSKSLCSFLSQERKTRGVACACRALQWRIAPGEKRRLRS